MSPFMPTSSSFLVEDESTSKFSSSVVDSNSSRDSSVFDLKLGRFVDQRDAHAHNSKISGNPLLSSESSTPPRRARLAGITLRTAFCQVYGCNKDLSSSKDYYKRHKVCEAHSKAAKVIVNGLEQRFCQQCSRFHLLAEFDDRRRSCRRRLADHNLRRRKPQVSVHSGQTGNLLQSFNVFADCRFQGTTLTTSSFIGQDKYGINDWCKRIKHKDGTHYNPVSPMPIASASLPSKSLFPHNFEKAVPLFHGNGASTTTESIFCLNSSQFPHDLGGPNLSSMPITSASLQSKSLSHNFEKALHFFHGNEATTTAESIFCLNGSQYPHDLGGPDSGSTTLFQDTSLGIEEFNVFDSASTIQQGLSGVSQSGCALCLLSKPQRSCSHHLSGIPFTQPIAMPGSSNQFNITQLPEKFTGFTSHASTSVSNKFSSSGITSVDGSNLGLIDAIHFDINDGISSVEGRNMGLMDAIHFDINDGISSVEGSNLGLIDAIHFDINDGIHREPDCINTKDRLSCEDGATIDLLQLSSQLQRVEHQRQSMQVKASK